MLTPLRPTPEPRDAGAPPCPPSAVEEALRLFSRAIRAQQLYQANNPTYVRAIENLRLALGNLWTRLDELVLEVTDTQLRWYGLPVMHEPDRSADALPWLLFKDGLRELRLLRDVERDELPILVELCARVRKSAPDQDDLITLLWEQEFSFVRYRYVDVVLEGIAPLEMTEGARTERLVDPHAPRPAATGTPVGPRAIDFVAEGAVAAALEAEEAAPGGEGRRPAGLVRMEDFDSTLYFLDDAEVEYLRDAVAMEYRSDLHANVVGIVLDIYEAQADDAIRDEVVGVLEGLMVHLLASGQLRVVAMLLREVRLSAARARALTDAQREQLLSLADRLSEPAAVAQLLQALDERPEVVPADDLFELVEQLQLSALGTILGLVGKLQTPEVRGQVEGTIDRLARANPHELARLVGVPETAIATEAIRRAGAIRAAGAIPALGRALGHPEVTMRQAALQALSDIGLPGALQVIERCIDDPHREVRLAACRILATTAFRGALPRLEAAIRTRRAADMDLTERMALFEAYGVVCGEGGVALLDGLLNTRRFFGGREEAEVRACAAMALGRVGSASAADALRRASLDRDVLVRNAVARALRGRDA